MIDYRSATFAAAVALSAYGAASAKERILYQFVHSPFLFGGPLIEDKDHNLYGAAGNVVFRLTPQGAFKVLHSFTGPDGRRPWGQLVRDSAGNLYGVTAYGGSQENGVFYEIPHKGAFRLIHDFGEDGIGRVEPSGSLIMDSSGNVVGTLVGDSDRCPPECGRIFSFSAEGEFSFTYTFTGSRSDGRYPEDILDAGDGSYVIHVQSGGSRGNESILKYTNGTFTVLHSMDFESGWSKYKLPDC